MVSDEAHDGGGDGDVHSHDDAAYGASSYGASSYDASSSSYGGPQP